MKQDSYEDIINLPHHVSKTRKPMNLENRSAQFAPFAALTGYGDAIQETSRLTTNKKDLSETEKSIIDNKLRILNSIIKDKPFATFKYFVPDSKKSGGKYITVSGNVRRIDVVNNEIVFTDKKVINISDIIDICIEENI